MYGSSFDCDRWSDTLCKSLNPHYQLRNPKVDKDAKDIVAGRNKRPCGNGRIDIPFVKEQRNERAYKTGHYNYGDQ